MIDVAAREGEIVGSFSYKNIFDVRVQKVQIEN
jgi:hypothetical protein